MWKYVKTLQYPVNIKKKDLREGKLVDAAFKQTRKPKDSKENKALKKDIKNKSHFCRIT